ncbi:sensor histidine kinase [Deferrisoma palaeochoriense]
MSDLFAVGVDRLGALTVLALAVLFHRETRRLPRTVDGVYLRWFGGLIALVAMARVVSHVGVPVLAARWPAAEGLYPYTGALNTVLFAGLAVATWFHRQTGAFQRVVEDEKNRLRRDLAGAQAELRAHRDRLAGAVETAREILRRVVERGEYGERFPDPEAPACWERFDCPDAACEARGRTDERCWRIRGGAGADRPCRFPTCAECPVYREATAGEIGALAETVNDLLFLLDREARDRRLFLSALSHDIRGQLGSVRGFLDLLASPTPSEAEPGEILALARFSLERVMHLAETLVLEGRAKARTLAPAPRPFEAAAALGRLARTFGPQARMRGVELRVQADEPAPPAVRADPMMVERAVANLVDNALKHAPRGSRVTLAARATPSGGLRIEVADEGPGIPPERRDEVFRPFRTWDERGTGLGLFVVAAVARAHGGRAGVEDGPGGRGSRFWVELPPAPPQREAGTDSG